MIIAIKNQFKSPFSVYFILWQVILTPHSIIIIISNRHFFSLQKLSVLPIKPSRERKRGREMKSSHLWQRTHLFHLSRYRTSDTPSYSPPRSPLASNLSIALASPRLLSGLISSFARRPLLLLRLFCLVLCFIFWDVLVCFLLFFVMYIPFWSC